MQRSIYKSKIVKLVTGDTEKALDINIPTGTEVFVGATMRGSTNEDMVRVALEENGTTINDPLSVNWYNGQTGSFEQRSIELTNFKGGSQVTIRVTAEKAVSSDVYVEVVFKINEEPRC